MTKSRPVPFDPKDNVFLLAGPVKMHTRVLGAMTAPSFSHRGPEFAAVNKELLELLKYVFQTKNDVVVLSGSGTAGMEAAASSLLDPTDRVVAIDNGKFGNRMADLVSLYGKPEILHFEWGQPPDMGAVEGAIAKAGTKALFVTHNETSCGVANPLKEIAAMAHRHGVLVVADCVSSIGGLPVPVDDWGIDIAITGSQKCIGAPPGLAFVSVSKRAEEKMPHPRSLYLNLRSYLERQRKDGQYPFTPATHMFLAALEGLRMIKEETREARFSRVHRIGEATRAAAKAMGLELLPRPGYESDTVTAIHYPRGVDDAAFRGYLRERGVIISGGQDRLKGKVFRLGHMGTVELRDIAGALTVIGAAFDKQGFKADTGASLTALQSHL